MKAKLESLESFCFPSRRLEAGLLFSSLSLFSLSLFHFFHSKKKKTRELSFLCVRALLFRLRVASFSSSVSFAPVEQGKHRKSLEQE